MGRLYAHEVRCALRERNIVVNSLLVPLLAYPVILWLAVTGMTFVMGETEGLRSRVAVTGSPAAVAWLSTGLDGSSHIERENPPPAEADARRRLQEGSLDAVVEVAPAENGPAGNVEIRIAFNGLLDRSEKARDRLKEAVERRRDAWLREESGRRGLSPAEWQGFTLLVENAASRREMGSFLMSRMLPMLFLVMVGLGCFYPAIDATAGERERQTWETLLSTAASRTSIVAAKYLYVATFGGLAGLINVGAMVLTLRAVLAPVIQGRGGRFEIALPWMALPVLVVGAVCLAGLVAALMMVAAAFAKTFKEGQAMITPLYLLLIVPAILLQGPGLDNSFLLAAVPVVNVILAIQGAMAGTLHLPWLLVALAAAAAAVAVAVRLSVGLLAFEDVVVGSYTGNLKRFLKERVLRRRSVAGAGSGGRS